MARQRSQAASRDRSASIGSHGGTAQTTKQRKQRKELKDEPAILEPRVRKISQATITSKWSALSPAAQQHAQDTLKAAKRTIVMSHWDERRRTEADLAINAAIKKVERRMPRMRFPPKTKDIHFDLDKLTENTRLLESQLTSAIHAVELLKAEIKKEDAALDVDRDQLAELQKNAKAEYRECTKQASKTHPLLQATDSGPRDDTAEEIRLRKPRANAEDDLEGADPDIANLFQQFSSHLQSMSKNHEQVHGLRDVIMEAQIELDRVLPGKPDIKDSS
ncbi:MAG: hypothetical protein M1821_003886 [Bathelium mastoideum]|nr:MAG: hypothetical protein M1821_003886 [Bathelium mastoideum]KAI9690963.1 MAG: hypothetical protein M1822_008583 [Bathelium mastoideum]